MYLGLRLRRGSFLIVLPPVAPMLQLIFAELPTERIPVNPQQMRGARLISIHAIQHALNEALLEFADRLVEQDAALHHLAN